MRTPALPLAVRCWHELLTAGHIDDGAVAVAWDHKAIVAFYKAAGRLEKPIGVLTWQDIEWSSTINVALAYVVPEARMLGVHTALWDELVVKAQQMGRQVISSSVSTYNLGSKAAIKSQGRQFAGLIVKFAVPQRKGAA
jgi:hypothetical protein